MKFLCEQCKAKYQIADDKVAGKTVRMKCRKCGHMIEVRAEVTETSVAQGLPHEDGSKKAPARPAVAKGGLATSLTARPPPPKGKPDALAGAFQRKVRQEAPESTASIEMLDSNASSGWYVAINGVPVGPIRISELRRKAANGAVTEDSLVWREGLEEWRPVRSVTEIAEIVREAMMSGRPSLVTPPPNDVRQSAPPPAPVPAPRGPSPARPQQRAPEPPRAAPLAARSNVVPFTGRLATAEKREEDEDIDIDEDIESAQPSEPPVPVVASSASAIAAMAAPAGTPAPAPLPERPSMVTSDPFALPPPAVAASAPLPMSSVSAPIAMSQPIVVSEGPRPAPKQTNWMAIGMVGAFIAFGVTGAIVAFKKDPAPAAPQPVVVTVVKEVDKAPAPTEPGSIDIGSLDPEGKPKTPGKGGTAGKTAQAPAAKGNTLGLDPSLLGADGPRPGVNPGGASPSPGPRGQLTSEQVQSTLRNYQTGVKRTCWERSGSNISSANIDAKIVVASNGIVQSVDATGNEPTIAKCIENQIRNWHFPASGETSTVMIPFRFVRQ